METRRPIAQTETTGCGLIHSITPLLPITPILKHLNHISPSGEATMVDVSSKPILHRHAIARGEIRLHKSTLKLIQSQAIAKGNVLAAARLAGILAAKKTGELIPLCHPLPITHCEVNFEIPKTLDRIIITASAKIAAQTGVEMEAITAVSIAALTIYDMCKAVDKQMRITDIKLMSKTKR
jgi:cyclic pyranopterin phosphate synthase